MLKALFAAAAVVLSLTACNHDLFPPEEGDVSAPAGEYTGRRVVALVPGFLGSLSRADFNNDNQVIDWVEKILAELRERFPEEVVSDRIPDRRALEPILGTYDDLVAGLEERDLTVAPFVYDWKRHPRDLAPALGEFVAEIAAQNPASLVVVGYSYGGLVLRQCLQEGLCAGVDEAVLLGVPNEGTLLAYLLRGGRMAAGNVAENFIAERILGLMKLAWCPLCSDSRFVREYLPSVEAMLPASEEPFISRRQRWGRTEEISVLNSCRPNRWLYDLNRSAAAMLQHGTRVTVIAGVGTETLSHLGTNALTPAADCELHNPAWPDGRPPRWFGKRERYADGDGTVTRSSAAPDWPAVSAEVAELPLGHRQLVSSEEVFGRIAALAGGK